VGVGFVASLEERQAITFRKAIEDLDPKTPLSEAVQKATKEANEVQPAWFNDVKFFRYAVLGLIIITLVVIVCSTIVIGLGETPVDGLIAIGSAAVGALVGIFSRPQSSDNTKS
jgi:hypothetical protein